MNQDNNHPVFAKHSDVMNAKPNNENEKKKLVDEIKRRGNISFKQESFQEAEGLYTKAIELSPNNNTLYSNRSAARCGMNKTDLALEDALKCISIEPKWAKGYFRKGQVLLKLKKFGEAYVAFQRAVELEPTNKGAKKQMEQAKNKAENLGQELSETSIRPKSNDSNENKSNVVNSKPKESKKIQKPKPNKNNKERVDDIDMKDLKGNVKGYKVLADGRKTTYFNNELSEDARRLIGDIAPKKIGDASAVQIENVEGGSAWNQGNTFEEKDVSSWAKSRIEELLKNVEHEENDMMIQVNEVKNLSGDASIAVSRGKKRYIFDYTFELECVGICDDLSTKGKLKFLDMSSDCNRDYDVEVVVPSRYDTLEGKTLYNLLIKSTSSFRTMLNEKLYQFENEFNSM